MRALIRDGSALRLETTRPEPAVMDGDVRVRPRLALVSGLETDVAHGVGGFEGIVGSAAVATVDAPDHALHAQRVAIDPVTWCGECDLCLGGLREHCRHGTIMGRFARDGVLAESCAVPEDNLLPVPDDLDDDRAVFAPLVAAAAQTRRTLAIEGKPYITVLGDGPLGLLTAQVLHPLNASVRIIGRYSEKLALAERWGIRHRHVDDVGRRGDQDIVVDCTGSPSGFSTALGLVRPRGTIVLKSMWRTDEVAAAPIDGAALVGREVRVLGSSGGAIAEALHLLRTEAVDVLPLISRRLRLDDGPAIIDQHARSGALATTVAIG